MKKFFLFLVLAMPMLSFSQVDNNLKSKAEAGDVKSLIILGKCYENGAGVPVDSAMALRCFQRAAEKGSGPAWGHISSYYLIGTLMPKDTARCLAIRKEWAEKGDPDAMALLGYAFLRGYGIIPDTSRAVELFREAAAKGSCLALCAMGDAYYWKNFGYTYDEKKALDYWKKSLKAGYWFAAVRLADYYVRKKDYKSAWKYANEGARWGDVNSITIQAEMLCEGNGVPADEAKALKMMSELLEKHHNLNYPCYSAGQMFLLCKTDVLRDSARGIGYWKYGAERGSQLCRYALMQYLMTEKHYDEAHKYANDILSEKGDNDYKGEACMELSRMSFYGMGCPVDEDKAMQYLQLGADTYNDAKCCSTLGSFHAGGVTGHDKAEKYFKRAIELGEIDAYESLIRLYFNDEDVKSLKAAAQEMIDKGIYDGYYFLAAYYDEKGDPAKSDQAIKDGCKKGSDKCLNYMGYYYEDETQLTQDYKKSLSYYQKSKSNYALYRSALLYLNGKVGKGTEKDMSKGLELLQRAADEGYIDAISTLGYIYETGRVVGEVDYEKAFKYYKMLADNDVPSGLFKVGLFYELGDGVAADSVKAVEYYTRAAELGDGSAMSYLGDFYREGHYVPMDKEKAFQYYVSADSVGSERGSFFVAYSYMEGCGVPVDTAKAIPYLKAAAAGGIGEASYQLAEFYNYGKGTLPADGDSAGYYYHQAHDNGNGDASYVIGRSLTSSERFDEAVSYLYEGARRGNPNAAVLFAVYLQQGVSLEKDPVSAYSILESVVKKYDNPGAYYQLGLARLNGNGCQQSETLGKLYLDTAAMLGSDNAMRSLGICYLNGYGCQIDTAEAIRWFRNATEMGSLDACNRLGDLYEAQENYDSAFVYFKRAADAGYLESYCNLGYLYESGHGVILSHKKAFELYSYAAEQGYPRGFLMLGYCYMEGIHVDADAVAALKWFTKAAEAGNLRGMYNVAVMLEQGENGIQRDIKKAKYWYKQAADAGYEPAIKALSRMK